MAPPLASCSHMFPSGLGRDTLFQLNQSLVAAAAEGDCDAIGKLVDDGADVDWISTAGSSGGSGGGSSSGAALHCASRHGHEEAARLLLEASSLVAAVSCGLGVRGCLCCRVLGIVFRVFGCWCLVNGFGCCVNARLQRGACADIIAPGGRTPLHEVGSSSSSSSLELISPFVMLLFRQYLQATSTLWCCCCR